ncbi:hypothetical protein HBA43_15540 [Providencia rettgeri]|uniref:hypothetical protein n=1 Tax=Providencia rettgeri TaxID=587 RepID=UPI00141A26A6|nr:hypothetical protein [Providencia rettgeri]NIA73991.1 hypothetical protein [Providencia rettgeri]NIA79809.1 hypothetical protein [Providencia rettgeri]NIB03029.1 hypothetical protein [Providencia rettgeri]NIB07196.1 hypothetical protein [Providencia rettgeri]NIB20721.1 hypothetical protein [Providencia rettgeri]
MNNKLQEEIEKIQNRAAGELVNSWYLARLANTILIACYSLDKGNIRLAKEWLSGAMEMWPDVDIFEDLKDSNGSAEDLQAWFDKGMEGELNHSQALKIIHKEYPELQRAYQINIESDRLIEAFCADDTELHKLLDKRDEENSILINLVVKLADKCSEMQKKLEHINNLPPVGYAAEIDISEIEIYGQIFLNEDPTEETNIPLYRLNK